MGTFLFLKGPGEPRPFAAAAGYGEIFFNHHAGCRTHHGILENAANIAGPLMFRHLGKLHIINGDGSFINGKDTGNGI